MAANEVQNAIDIAKLQVGFDNLRTTVVEVRDEMRQSNTSVNAKLDTLIAQVTVQKATSSMRAKALSALSHFSAGALPLIAAKVFHIPIISG